MKTGLVVLMLGMLFSCADAPQERQPPLEPESPPLEPEEPAFIDDPKKLIYHFAATSESFVAISFILKDHLVVARPGGGCGYDHMSYYDLLVSQPKSFEAQFDTDFEGYTEKFGLPLAFSGQFTRTSETFKSEIDTYQKYILWLFEGDRVIGEFSPIMEFGNCDDEG